MSREPTTEITPGRSEDPRAEFREGVELLKGEYLKKAIVKLKRAFESDKHNPYYISFLGLAIARAERKWVEAWELCERAVQLRPKEIHFHLNLADVYALAGQRGKVLDTLDKALQIFGNDERLERARIKADSRRAPLLPFLGRENFLNRGLGRLRHHILKKLDR